MEDPIDRVVEIDQLERSLLLDDTGSNQVAGPERDDADNEESILYTASFKEAENNFVKYQTARWVLYSLLLILAWGFGLLMLLYLPVRRYVLRKDIRSRKLFLTPNAIVYIVTRPVAFPCFGVLKKEKYIVLPSVADIVIEQGYLQSRFGVYSIRIENAGVRRLPSDDVQIQGIVNPLGFRKAVLMHLSNMKKESSSREGSTIEGVPHPRIAQSPVSLHGGSLMSPSRSLRHDSISRMGEVVILRKLEEVGSSVKRLESLIEEQRLNQQNL